MEQYSSGRHVAVIENCVMTAMGIQQLFRHGLEPGFHMHFFKEGRDWFSRAEHPPYDIVIYSVAGNRHSRQGCMSFFTQLAKAQPDALRVLLAEDERQATLIHHLSAVSLNGALCKASSLAKLKAQLKDLLTNKELPGLSRPVLNCTTRSVGLSPTERTILEYMGRGLSVSDIARQMERNAKTIRTHKFNVMTKLGVNNDSGLLCAADILRSQSLQQASIPA